MPTMKTTLALATVLGAAGGALAQYSLAQEYKGSTFFDRWDFYGAYDNLTNVSASRSAEREVLKSKDRAT